MYLIFGWDFIGRGGIIFGFLWDFNCDFCRFRLSFFELLYFLLCWWYMEVFWGFILYWFLYRVELSSFIICCFLIIYLCCVFVWFVFRFCLYIVIFFFLLKRISLFFCIFFIKYLVGDVILLLLKVGKWWI